MKKIIIVLCLLCPFNSIAQDPCSGTYLVNSGACLTDATVYTCYITNTDNSIELYYNPPSLQLPPFPVCAAIGLWNSPTDYLIPFDNVDLTDQEAQEILDDFTDAYQEFLGWGIGGPDIGEKIVITHGGAPIPEDGYSIRLSNQNRIQIRNNQASFGRKFLFHEMFHQFQWTYTSIGDFSSYFSNQGFFESMAEYAAIVGMDYKPRQCYLLNTPECSNPCSSCPSSCSPCTDPCCECEEDNCGLYIEDEVEDLESLNLKPWDPAYDGLIFFDWAMNTFYLNLGNMLEDLLTTYDAEKGNPPHGGLDIKTVKTAMGDDVIHKFRAWSFAPFGGWIDNRFKQDIKETVLNNNFAEIDIRIEGSERKTLTFEEGGVAALKIIHDPNQTFELVIPLTQSTLNNVETFVTVISGNYISPTHRVLANERVCEAFGSPPGSGSGHESYILLSPSLESRHPGVDVIIRGLPIPANVCTATDFYYGPTLLCSHDARPGASVDIDDNVDIAWAEKVVLNDVPEGTVIKLFGNNDEAPPFPKFTLRQDDWLEIRVKNDPGMIEIPTLEESDETTNFRAIYHSNNNGLNNGVELYKVYDAPSGPTIDFYDDEDLEGSLQCSIELLEDDASIDFSKEGIKNICDDNESESVVLYDLPAGMTIQIFADTEAEAQDNIEDDWLRITVLADIKELKINSLELCKPFEYTIGSNTISIPAPNPNCVDDDASFTNSVIDLYYNRVDDLKNDVSWVVVGLDCAINPLAVTINTIQSIGCGGTAGIYEADVSGGTPPYTYKWTNKNGTQVSEDAIVTAAIPGIYVVEVRDSRDCSSSKATFATKVITVTDKNITDASCIVPDGSIKITEINSSTDLSSYDFQWDAAADNQTSETANNLAPGLYSVTITDAGNCTGTKGFIVKEKNNLELTINKEDASSCNADDGWAEVRITGLEGQPMILWSAGGATTTRIEGLAPDMYTVDVVDDVNNCRVEGSVTISQPEVNISGGGIRPYVQGTVPSAVLTALITCNNCTYMWSTDQMGRSITVSESGTYTVTVDDGNGCIYQDTQTVIFFEVVGVGGGPPNNCSTCPCAFWSSVNKTLLRFNGCPPWWDFPVLHAFDPNDIAGNIGYEEDRWVSVNERLGYVIRFENDAEFATGPAQTVTIRHPLDPNVDPYTIRLSNFGFGSFNFSVPPNSITYNERLDVRDSLDVFVDVIAGIDVQNNEAFWILKSIDPATGQTPIDASLGFLEVTDTTLTRFNDTIPKASEGFVSYSIMPKSTSVTGDTVLAQASIIFDQNAAIETNIWKNTIDAFYPVSNMNPATYDQGSVILTWTGQDDPGGVGVQNYDIYYSLNGGEFELLASDISGNTYTFQGEPGNTYEFFTIARDWVNNVEPLKDGGDIAVLFEGVTLPACTIMNIPPVDAINNGACITALSSWQHLTNDLGEVLLSINPMGNNLGDISADLYVDDAPIVYDGDTYLLQRHYRVVTENVPQSGVMLRLYLTEQELANLMNITSVGSLDDLVVVKYSGTGEDDVYDPTQGGTLEILAPNETGADFNADYIEIMVDDFGEFWIGNLLLPIELIDFYAVNKSKEVELKWQTANEQNSDYYDVQRSRNGTNFESIGKVQAVGNSSTTQNYTHTDHNPISGTSYYRLQQFDVDGNNSYSKVIAVKRERISVFNIYPNPAEDHIMIDYPGDLTGDLAFEMYDAIGQLVLTKNWQLPINQKINVPIDLLPSGIYLVRLKHEKHRIAQKIVKK